MLLSSMDRNDRASDTLYCGIYFMDSSSSPGVTAGLVSLWYILISDKGYMYRYLSKTISNFNRSNFNIQVLYGIFG